MRKAVPFVSLTFAAPPSVNASTRNVEGIGRVKTKAYKDWIKEAGQQILIQRPGRVAGGFHLTMRVRRASLRRDLDNYAKCAIDLLVSMNVVDDDRHCESINLAWTDEGEGVSVMLVSAQQASEAA